MEKGFLGKGEGAELHAALTLLNNAENVLVVYFEVTNTFNRKTGHEEVAADKNVDFPGLLQPIIMVYITDSYTPFADIYNPSNPGVRFSGNCNNKACNIVTLVFSSFSV